MLANECVESPVIELLRASGFDVEPLLDYCPQGQHDDVVLWIADYLDRTLLTYDRSGRDFGALRDSTHPGLFIVNCRLTDLDSLSSFIAASLGSIALERGTVYVAEPGRIRMRHTSGKSTVLAVSNVL